MNGKLVTAIILVAGVLFHCAGIGAVQKEAREMKSVLLVYESGSGSYTDTEAGIRKKRLVRKIGLRFWQNDKRRTLPLITREMKKVWPDIVVVPGRSEDKDMYFQEAAKSGIDTVVVFSTLPSFFRDKSGNCRSEIVGKSEFYDVSDQTPIKWPGKTVVSENLGKCDPVEMAKGNLIRFAIADYYKNLGREFRMQVLEKIR